MIFLPPEFLLATQWYFILLYALVGVALVAIVILLIWCCYSTRHYWFVKVKTTVIVRKRVKKKMYAEARRKSQETGQRLIPVPASVHSAL